MYRILPLFLLLTACAGDPLDVTIVDLADTDSVTDGLTTIDYDITSPLTGEHELLASHEDLTLKFSFRTTAGTDATLSLQGQYPFALADMSLSGQQPRITANPSPGIWHDLELIYKAATETTPAILSSAYLDGNLLHFQQELPTSTASAGPLRLEVKSGSLELDDLRYTDVAGTVSYVNDAGEVELSIPLIHYAYYELEDGVKEVKNWAQLTPKKTGYLDRFDLGTIRERGRGYAVRFTGQLDVPQAGEYAFRLYASSIARLYIDGNLYVSVRDQPAPRKVTEKFQLSEGTHDIRVDYVQTNNWSKVDVAYLAPGAKKERYLNTMVQGKPIAKPAAANPLRLEPGDEPYLLRSFLFFPAPKVYDFAEKRTHVLSVGEAAGPHYSVDLQTGALLQLWRGAFADVHDMWVGRGEPQVMRPLGPALSFDGSPQWALSANDPWPEPPTIYDPDDEGGYAPDEDEFIHQSYELDEDGRPTFRYRFANRPVSDKIVPAGDGLQRELTNGGASAYTQLASGTKITEVAPGEFTLRGPGVKLKIESYDGSGLTIQREGGLERLIAEVPTDGHVRYRIDW